MHFVVILTLIGGAVLWTPYGGRLKMLLKQGSWNVMDFIDSRFRGNNKLCYIISLKDLPFGYAQNGIFDLNSIFRAE